MPARSYYARVTAWGVGLELHRLDHDDDARPDRWGERVIKFLDKPPRLSLLEYLYFAGDDRFGALGVSTSNEAYRPRRIGPLPKLADTAAIQVLVRKVQCRRSCSTLTLGASGSRRNAG